MGLTGVPKKPAFGFLGWIRPMKKHVSLRRFSAGEFAGISHRNEETVPGLYLLKSSVRDVPSGVMEQRNRMSLCRLDELAGDAVMQFQSFSFGSIQIDGATYEHDVVIDRGEVRKRKKGPSKPFREAFGHTPLSIKEKIPWKCHRLVIGTGTGALPVMEEVKKEARRREIELFILPTVRAIDLLKRQPAGTNAILHVTC